MTEPLNPAALAAKILDLVSHRHPATQTQPELREGFDTLLEGIDDEAAQIIAESFRQFHQQPTEARANAKDKAVPS